MTVIIGTNWHGIHESDCIVMDYGLKVCFSCGGGSWKALCQGSDFNAMHRGRPCHSQLSGCNVLWSWKVLPLSGN